MGWTVTKIVEKVEVTFILNGRLQSEMIHTDSRRYARNKIKEYYPEAKIIRTEPFYRWERN